MTAKKYLLWTIFLVVQISIFLVFSSEVREWDSGQPEFVGKLDKAVINMTFEIREPFLTGMAMDITSLGSTSILTLTTLLAFLFFLTVKKISDGIYIVIISTGAGILSQIMKTYFERPRPSLSSHLVEVQGFSYPSGHTLVSTAFYLNLALLVCAYFPKNRQRYFIFTFAIGLICLIASSRIYLGVHYPTDVIAGVMLGAVWTTFAFGLKIILKAGSSWNY